MNHIFEDPEGLKPALKAGRCQHWEQGVSSPRECVRIRGGGGKEDTGQTDRQILLRANTRCCGRIDGHTDEVSARVAVGGSQPRPGLGETWPTGGYARDTQRHTRWSTQSETLQTPEREEWSKGPQTHTHSRNDSQKFNKAPLESGKESEQLSEVKPDTARGGGEGLRHTDRRDSDTAHGKSINTDPHMLARPGSSTWKMLGVRGQWMNSWEGKWVWSHWAN